MREKKRQSKRMTNKQTEKQTNRERINQTARKQGKYFSLKWHDILYDSIDLLSEDKNHNEKWFGQ